MSLKIESPPTTVNTKSCSICHRFKINERRGWVDRSKTVPIEISTPHSYSTYKPWVHLAPCRHSPPLPQMYRHRARNNNRNASRSHKNHTSTSFASETNINLIKIRMVSDDNRSTRTILTYVHLLHIDKLGIKTLQSLSA